MAIQYDYIEEILPKDIFFITSQELEDLYSDCTPKEREYRIVKEKGAVFIMQIGGVLTSGQRHDGRAPDYDDWALNGDIIVYYPVLDIALELSSMGNPRGRGKPAASARNRRMPGAGISSVPEGDSRKEAALHHRRRHRSVAYLYVLSAKGAHRRGAGVAVAGGNHKGSKTKRYSSFISLRTRSLVKQVSSSLVITDYRNEGTYEHKIYLKAFGFPAFVLLLILLAVLIDEVFALPLPFPAALIPLAIGGGFICYDTLETVWRTRSVTTGILVVLALIGTIFTGEFMEGAEVSFMMLLGEALEDFTMEKHI